MQIMKNAQGFRIDNRAKIDPRTYINTIQQKNVIQPKHSIGCLGFSRNKGGTKKCVLVWKEGEFMPFDITYPYVTTQNFSKISS